MEKKKKQKKLKMQSRQLEGEVEEQQEKLSPIGLDNFSKRNTIAGLCLDLSSNKGLDQQQEMMTVQPYSTITIKSILCGVRPEFKSQLSY